MVDSQHQPAPVVGFYETIDAPSYDLLVHCMRCGLCLSVCPTYAIYGTEKANPRGRLALMRAVSEGFLEVTPGFGEAMDLCLGCLACQTACPAGVDFGHLLENARQQAEAKQKSDARLGLMRCEAGCWPDCSQDLMDWNGWRPGCACTNAWVCSG